MQVHSLLAQIVLVMNPGVTSTSVVSLTVSRCFFMEEELMEGSARSCTWSRLRVTAGYPCWIICCTCIYTCLLFFFFFLACLHLVKRAINAMEKYCILLLIFFQWFSQFQILLPKNCQALQIVNTCIYWLVTGGAAYREVSASWVPTEQFSDNSVPLLSERKLYECLEAVVAGGLDRHLLYPVVTPLSHSCSLANTKEWSQFLKVQKR